MQAPKLEKETVLKEMSTQNLEKETVVHSKKKEMSKKEMLIASRVEGPLNGRCNGTVLNEKSDYWDPNFKKLPKFVRYAIATPYNTIKIPGDDEKKSDKSYSSNSSEHILSKKRARDFFGSLRKDQLKDVLNTFYANRNPYYGTQRRFTSKDTKIKMIDFILTEPEINTSVVRDAFLCWLLNTEHILYIHFWVV